MAAAGMPPALLVGHSLGGTAAIVAAAALPDVAAVVTIVRRPTFSISARFRPGDLDAIASEGEASVEIAGRPPSSAAPSGNGRASDIEKSIAALRRPVLVMHSPVEKSWALSTPRIFVASRHPKSFVSLDTADHLLTDVDDANYASAMVAAAWASQLSSAIAADLPQVEGGKGVVASETLAKFQLTVRVASILCSPTRPESVGGLGSGLSPYELVSAGLAACTVMTMRLYANRKGFPLGKSDDERAARKVADMMPPDRFHAPSFSMGRSVMINARAFLRSRIGVRRSTLVRGSDVQTELSSGGQPTGARPIELIGTQRLG